MQYVARDVNLMQTFIATYISGPRYTADRGGTVNQF